MSHTTWTRGILNRVGVLYNTIYSGCRGLPDASGPVFKTSPCKPKFAFCPSTSRPSCPASVPSSQLRTMFAPMIPIRGPGNMCSRSSRRSRSMFLGNIPDTACRMICRREYAQLVYWRARGNALSAHLFWFSSLHLLVRDLFQSSREHGMTAINELLGLFTSHFDLARVCNDDMVSTVHCISGPLVSECEHATTIKNAPLGSYIGLCFPMSTRAIRSAIFPRIRSDASTWCHTRA